MGEGSITSEETWMLNKMDVEASNPTEHAFPWQYSWKYNARLLRPIIECNSPNQVGFFLFLPEDWHVQNIMFIKGFILVKTSNKSDWNNELLYVPCTSSKKILKVLFSLTRNSISCSGKYVHAISDSWTAWSSTFETEIHSAGREILFHGISTVHFQTFRYLGTVLAGAHF
jgi:hypothetical protein